MMRTLIILSALALAACNDASKEDLITARQWGGFCAVKGNSAEGCFKACYREFKRGYFYGSDEVRECRAGATEYAMKEGQL